ncbi:hypothetical protein [Vibrio sp. D431a]|uniref:hypothetical protein n=1 Tax=Vibrio sp. D431a TaxID=2837388 RepID=UPI002552D2F2|nr:hypothetical protein [Vibrio sp. D431a]MDK9793742.1 hypothetical protein [Vibrio sp. D431a]
MNYDIDRRLQDARKNNASLQGLLIIPITTQVIHFFWGQSAAVGTISFLFTLFILFHNRGINKVIEGAIRAKDFKEKNDDLEFMKGNLPLIAAPFGLLAAASFEVLNVTSERYQSVTEIDWILGMSIPLTVGIAGAILVKIDYVFGKKSDYEITTSGE